MIKSIKYTLIFIIFLSLGNISKLKAESLEDIEKELGEIREKISELKTNNVKEAIKIDSALTEIDQVIEFVEKNVKSGDLETAIATINIAETAIKDISKSIPSEFKATKVKAGKEFNEQEMKEITNITNGLNKNTAIKKEEIAKDIEAVQSEGLDVKTISQNISASGIKTSLVTNTVNKGLIANTSLQKELADQEKYGAIIGSSPEKVSVAMKQVNIIQSGNPKDHRALEIEKYGLEAGLSRAQIQKGIEAVYSGNLKAETEVTKEIYSKLSQNQNWVVESADIDAMMQQNIAVEKAANAILKSGINFSKGTNSQAVDILSNQVATILAGTTDQATIDKITYKIGRTKFEIWDDPNAVAANMIAEIAGPDQVDALVAIKNDQKFGITKSLVEQAARVEAKINGDTDSFIAASNGVLDSVSLSSSDKAQLGEVYKQAISSKSLSASASSAAGEFKSAASIAATLQAEELKKANSIVEQTKVSSEAFNNFIKTKYEGDGSEWKAARKEWLDSEKLRQDLEASNNMSSIAAQMAVEAAGEVSASLNEKTKSLAQSEVDQAWNTYTELQSQGKFKEAAQARGIYLELNSKKSLEDVKKRITEEHPSTLSETAKSAASEVSNSVSQTAKSAASEVSSSVAETAKESASEVASSVSETAKEAAKEAAKEVAETAKEVASESVKESVKEAITQSDLDKAWNDYVGLQSQGKYKEAEQARQKMLNLRHEKFLQDK